MRHSIKQNPWFFLCLAATLALGLLLVHVLGFWGMANTISPMPERLRNMTFPIWDQHSVLKHGFLVFIKPTGFQDGIGYSNHSTAYLLFMYLFYKIEMYVPKFSMRVVVAYLEMLFFTATVTYIALSGLKERIKFNQGLLVLLALMFLVTMPDFWISAGKFNVDNPFHLQVPLLLLVAHKISNNESSGTKLWIPLGTFCAFFPMMTALLGAYLAVSSIRNEGQAKHILKLSLLIIFISVIVYLQPVITAKILGFSSANSTWLHRAGLEGDTSSFNNVLNSIFKPFYPRPAYLLLVPMCLLLAQLVFIRAKGVSIENGKKIPAGGGNSTVFYGVIFSQYLVIALLWPQSVSIHPYLYDFLLVGPICVWIFLNFAGSRTLLNNPQVWIWVMLFFISFNLQQIAQANACFYCFYPTWTPIQYIIKP
jgi:hypothetical protein